ncbi:MAG: Gfo/Idh/MocA family oxidoreductase [Anaerolineales bacterium]|nr:MAG: Gfo/Idh/MocA family oxidoreductase [Anaerolineales bacterium]
MKRLGVAVVGLGIGEKHLRAYQKDSRCEIRWVLDHNHVKAKNLAEETGAGAASDYQAIVSDETVKIVSIASFDDDHASQVIQALIAGKHVFVEKPMCQTVEQLKKIQQIWSVQNGRLKLASNLILRATPVYQWLKDRIQTGELGKIYSFDGEYLYGRLHKITDGWRNAVENYSVMEGGGVHLIDLMLWLINERPQTVFSMGNRISTEGTKFRYNDFVESIMQMESGLVAHITANFGSVHRHQHVVRVFGTKGTFIYDDMGARVHWNRDEDQKAEMLSMPTLPADKGDLIPDFISAVLDDRDIREQTQVVFDGISISAACDRALITKRLETIDYL